MELNVFGENLIICCANPATGYLRDGLCKTTPQDTGTHTVCAIVTLDFLEYSLLKGNDLTTPMPDWQFPGLKPGDKWCLCVTRWLEAEKAGKAPYVILEATHEMTLKYTSLEVLQKYKYE